MATFKPQHILFVANYVANVVEDPLGKDAAVIAGYNPEYGVKLLAMPNVQAMVQKRLLELVAPLGVTQRDVIQYWLDVATADPTEITRTRRTCCRHCWGVNNEYQWDTFEYAAEAKRCAEAGKPPPPFAGGMDWQHNQEANPECPKCQGEGIVSVYIADMTHISQQQRRLIAGVEQTKNGIKVTYHSQPDAWANIAKALGMNMASKVELTGKDGGPIETHNKSMNVNVDLKDLSPQEASKVYQALVSGKP